MPARSRVRRFGELRQLQWTDYWLLVGILGALLAVIAFATLSVS
jgi:hypothetical protein